MQRKAMLGALLGALLLMGALPGCGHEGRPQVATQAQAPSAPVVEKAVPEPPPAPLVLMGEEELTCEIDRARNGTQKLVLKKGSGIEFDATVSPIVDGTVDLRGPKQGGVYRFTSHLTGPAKGRLSGVGDVAIESLETKVSVEVTSYDQPAGPGTVFSFRAGEVAESGAYVEFAGVARAQNGQRYAFRVNLNQVKDGGGRVQPAGPGFHDGIAAKMVVVQSPSVMTLVESRATVERMP